MTQTQTSLSPTSLLHQTSGNWPCFLKLNTLALAYRTLQVGPTCAFATGHQHTLAAALLPEGALRTPGSAGTQVRPAILAGLVESFRLDTQTQASVLFGGLHYKLAPKESKGAQKSYATSKYNAYYLQRWADILESNFEFGFIQNFANHQDDVWAVRAFYTETLPVGLRRLGAIQEAAAVQAKFVSLGGRRRVGQWTWGGGLGYAVVTFDAVRLGIPVPDLHLSYLW